MHMNYQRGNRPTNVEPRGRANSSSPARTRDIPGTPGTPNSQPGGPRLGVSPNPKNAPAYSPPIPGRTRRAGQPGGKAEPEQLTQVHFRNTPLHAPRAKPATDAVTVVVEEPPTQSQNAAATAANPPTAVVHRAIEIAQLKKEWAEFCLAEAERNPKSVSDKFINDPILQPTTREDLNALKQMLHAASHRHEKLQDLFAAYKKNVPPYGMEDNVTRTAKTLQALLEENITPTRLAWACRMSWIRDLGAQEVVSLAGYTSTFCLFNTVLAGALRQGMPAPVGVLAGAAAHAVTGLAMQRFLRAGEMYPGWTTAVEQGPADTKAIQTASGFSKIASQYWPFAGSLGYASLGTPDPLDAADKAGSLARTIVRVDTRRQWGFAATACVALHRMVIFNRDHSWLNATTEQERRTMIGAINELTSPWETVKAIPKYLVVRPVAGLAGLGGHDLHPWINEKSESSAGVTQEAKGKYLYQPNAGASLPSPLLEGKRVSLVRLSALFLPMMLFQVSRELAAADPEHSNAINVANDALLIVVWGLAMALAEQTVTLDPALSQESKSRASRQSIGLARISGPPRSAVAPESKDRDVEIQTHNIDDLSPPTTPQGTPHANR